MRPLAMLLYLSSSGDAHLGGDIVVFTVLSIYTWFVDRQNTARGVH